jgi:hypothetical protein
MKRCIAALLLCLLLAGCSDAPVLETTPVVLPTPALPTEAMTPTAENPPAVPEFVFSNGPVPRAEQDANGQWRIVGPAGSVQPAGYYCAASAWGDVDRDGHLELVYLAPGRTSGIRTQELYVYDLEDGWPVCTGSSTLILTGPVSYGQEQFLVAEDSKVFYCFDREERNEAYGYVRSVTELLPISLENGEVLLAGGSELPDGIACQSNGQPVFGASLSALTVQVRSDAFWQFPGCLVWRKTLEVPEGEVSPDSETIVMAAVSDNGVTVTGSLSWWPQEGGSVTCYSEGVVPVPAQEDYEALARLSFDELQSDLGPYHADIGSGQFLPSWFTADGKLITASGGDAASSITILDLLSGKHSYYGQKFQVVDADTIIILSGQRSSTVQNQERWNAFLERTAKGTPDSVQLRFVGNSTETMQLSYDGTDYTLTNQTGEQHYACLITDLELVERDAASPTQAAYTSAIHYLLSDDPDMTTARYYGVILSSSIDPDSSSLARTRLLFSLYSFGPGDSVTAGN